MYQADCKRYNSMKYFRCGTSGLKLPAISLGLWYNFGSKDNFDIMKEMCFTGFDLGITHFDLANNYGPVPGSAEENFGRILKSDFRSYRDELIISTKAGYTMWDGPYGDGGSRKYLLASLDQSLKRMGLEYVDIFYHHRMDMDTPIEESLWALAQAVKSGKALYAGISNYNQAYTQQAISIMAELKCPLVLNQRRYSMFDRKIEEDGVKNLAVQEGLGIIAFSPLEQGLLSEKYLHGIPQDSRIHKDGRFLKPEALSPQKLNQIRALNQIAQERNQTLPQMALSWVLRDQAVTSVVIGASRPEQIKENVQFIDRLDFTEEELKKIDQISLGEV